ncbi:cytochrome P450 [Nocardia sp. XZ_19_385]|uniref:cytochrome P450 n=1 Tax=Nocardia sp. XZ_19_385 TaxID=2769488 RepID=UPI00188FCAA1|nr:cytochrome P450 [Nocardia sp. XZ_19_385]
MIDHERLLNQRMFTTAEVAKLLGVDESTLRRWRRSTPVEGPMMLPNSALRPRTKEHMPVTDVVFDDTYFRDPHAFYQQIQQQGPLHRFTTPSGVHGWLITSAPLARAVLTDARIGKGRDTMLGVSGNNTGLSLRQRLLRASSEWVVSHMLGSDPPDHTRLRHAVADHFTPRAVTALQPRIDTLTQGFIDTMDPTDPVDLVTALACPLPVAVICEILGVSDRHQHRIERSSAILSDVTVARARELRSASLDFTRLILPHFATRRLRPREDLITALTQQMKTGQVNLKESLSTVALLLIAGHETTANLILATLLALLRNPEELQRVRTDPVRLNAVIDEALRTDPPLPVATLRQAHTPIELTGQHITPGELLLVSLLAANHDPQTTSHPTTFHPDRPTRHLSFGTGIHHCLGARLARAETTAAITYLLHRYPNITLAVPPTALRWRRSVFFRRLESLPVHLNSEPPSDSSHFIGDDAD